MKVMSGVRGLSGGLLLPSCSMTNCYRTINSGRQTVGESL